MESERYDDRPRRPRRGPSVTAVREADLLWSFAKAMVSGGLKPNGPCLYMDETGKVCLGKVLYLEGPGEVQVFDYGGHASDSKLVTPLEGDALQRNMLPLFDAVWRDDSGYNYTEDVPDLPAKRDEKIVRLLICVQTGIFNPEFAIVALESRKRPQLELPILFTNGTAPSLGLTWTKAQEKFSWLENFEYHSGQHLYLRVRDDNQMHYMKLVVTPKKDLTEINDVYFGTPADFVTKSIGPHQINPRDSTHVGRLFSRERTLSYYTALVQTPTGWNWEERDKDGIHAGSFNAASRYCPPNGAIVQVWDSYDQAVRPAKTRPGQRRDRRLEPREPPEHKHRCIQNAKLVRWYQPNNVPVAPSGWVSAPAPAPAPSYMSSGYGTATNSHSDTHHNPGYSAPAPAYDPSSGYSGPAYDPSSGYSGPAYDPSSGYTGVPGPSEVYSPTYGEYNHGSRTPPPTPAYAPTSPTYDPSATYNPSSPAYVSASPAYEPSSTVPPSGVSSFPIQSYEDV